MLTISTSLRTMTIITIIAIIIITTTIITMTIMSTITIITHHIAVRRPHPHHLAEVKNGISLKHVASPRRSSTFSSLAPLEIPCGVERVWRSHNPKFTGPIKNNMVMTVSKPTAATVRLGRIGPTLAYSACSKNRP